MCGGGGALVFGGGALLIGGSSIGDDLGGVSTGDEVRLTFLTPAETKILVLVCASLERFGVFRMRDFFYKILHMSFIKHATGF